MLETKQKTDRRCEKYGKSTPIVPKEEMGLKIERRQDGFGGGTASGKSC